MSLRHLLEPSVDSLVSARRQLATVRMAAYAVNTLPAGDLVETGVFRGGTTVLMAVSYTHLTLPTILLV